MRASVALALAAGVLSGAASAAFIAVIGAALSSGPQPWWLLAAFAALCLLLPLFRFLSNVLLLRLSERTQFELRLDLCRRILSTPLRRIEEIGSPRMLAALTDDVGTIVVAFMNLPLLLMQLTVVVGCLIYMGLLSWELLLVVLGFLLLGGITYQLPMLRAQRYFRLVRESWDRQFRQFRGLTDGIKELKLHGSKRRAFIDEELVATARERMGYRIRAAVVHSVAASWGQALFFIVIGLVLFGLPELGRFDSRVLVGFTLAILYMLAPLDFLFSVMPSLNACGVAIRQVEDLGLSLAAAGSEPANGAPRGNLGWHQIELVGVTHSYRREGEDHPFTLGPLDLAIRPGECLFLVGGNGSGKTTLAKLVTGLYVPESGEIRLDGHPIGDGEREAYRQLFSAVFSDFYLFDRLMGLEPVQLEQQAQGYLRKLDLAHKVKIREGVFSTLDLSQGQRKRLALLNAYLEDRPIYLFDEWAADQDPVFKEIFYRQLLPELKARGKTAVVISHDERYYFAADRIIRLEEGKLKKVETSPSSGLDEIGTQTAPMEHRPLAG